MDISEIALNTVKVITAGVLLGAGLPALFAVGIRLWDAGGAHTDAAGTTLVAKPAARYAGFAVFGLIGLVVLYGIYFITKASLNHYLGISLPI
jgi:hypothetical protein